jgi:capsid protein
VATSTTETRGPLQGYDATRESSSRSVLLFPTNSRIELNTWTRRRLQEKNRALEANFAFVTRIKSKFGRCVAGKGIFPFPTTRDKKWNPIAKEYFERWASNPSLYSIDGSRDLWEDQRLSGEQLGAGDGEVFRLLARPEGMGPAIQPLDPFEIGSAWGNTSTGSEDGVQIDPYMRPIGYDVCELTGPNDFYGMSRQVRTVAAQDMVHVFRRRRDKQLRGLPPTYSALNDGNDVLDLLALEKAADKLHSLLAVAKTVRPENEGKGLTNQLSKILDSDGNTLRLEEKMPRGAATVELGLGEDIKLLTSGRPGAPLLEGIEFYCRMVALGVDLPLSVVFSFAELGGTPTRAELEDAQNTFEMMQDLLVWRHSQRIYTWRSRSPRSMAISRSAPTLTGGRVIGTARRRSPSTTAGAPRRIST